jgi:hypothetical protein
MLSAEFPERLRGRRIVAKRIPNVVGSRNVASQDPIPLSFVKGHREMVNDQITLVGRNESSQRVSSSQVGQDMASQFFELGWDVMASYLT